MAQNQNFAQYPYTQPQNIYQQLGKPQPQPHLQTAYQIQPQNQQLVHVPQQSQYSYQHPQHQSQNQTQHAPSPSPHGFQPPHPTSGLLSHQQAPQPQKYQNSQTTLASIPVPKASGTYQRSSFQNSRLPTSSFAGLAPGQPLPNVLTRQLGSSQKVTSPANSSSGQLVSASQSLTLRGQSPASSPGPPISPSAVFSQQANQQLKYQSPLQPSQGLRQNHQQTSSLSLVAADKNSVVAAKQRQSIPPSHTQLQSQSRLQHQTPYPIQDQSVHDPQLQVGQVGQTRSIVARRPLPTPGAPRTFPSVNTINPSAVPASSSVSDTSPTRDNILSKTAAQSNLPTKSTPTSPVKVPSSSNQTSRPLPAPGSCGGRTNSAEGGSGGVGPGREGFAGIGTKSSSSRITGLPIGPSVSLLVAGIEPHKLAILPLPDESSPEKEDTSINKPVKIELPNPPSLTQTESLFLPEGSSSVSKRRAASPVFQSSSSARIGATSGPSSPTKESSSLTTSSGHKSSPSASAATGQSPSHHSHVSDGSPTKKSTSVWKRTIPEYPQPVFGYATGMVKDPWTKSSSPTSSTSAPQKQSLNQAKPGTVSTLTQAVVKPAQADLDQQRAFVERQHVERQLNAAMTQTYAQTKRHQQITGMQPVSGASHSANAVYSRSNPDLHQIPDQHVRPGVYDHRDDDDEEEEEEENDSQDDDDEETEETEEEREIYRKKQGKKASELSINKKKKKKKSVTEGKGKGKEKEKEKEKEKKVAKKKLARSASMPPKKRTARQEISSTSEDDTESTEPTLEETEAEEENLRRTSRYKKSLSMSSSRFKAKVERGREALRRKRPQSHYDYLPEEYYDDEGTTRKSIQQLSTRRQSSPRYSYHQWIASSGFRQRSPSPPPNTRASRRVSPLRVSLLKDAQRKTIRLRGDDEDEFYNRGREKQQGMDRWKHGNQYRSRERFCDEEYAENERRHYPSSPYRKDGGGAYYGSHDQEERGVRYSLPRVKGGQNITFDMSGPSQAPTIARRRDTVGLQEDQLSKGGSDEREYGNKMFNLGRQEAPTRYPGRDETFATGYRSRPTSPESNFSRYQQPSVPVISSYHSRSSSPMKQPSDNRINEELAVKFSAIDVKDRGGNRSKEGEWPADLPRLPRTPGEAPSIAGDYFNGLQREDGLSYGSSVRSGRRDTRNLHHYDNLDDPPPRSISPALSQESTSYSYSEQPQQPQSFTNHRLHNKKYASVPANRSMQRHEPTQQPLPMVKSRPQSQIYNNTPLTTTELPRPQSINPYVREQMNKTKINNGTPKVQTIDIESPAPVGGREKCADLDKMMSDPEDEGFRTPVSAIDPNDEFVSQRDDISSQGPMIEVTSPARQVDEQSGGQVHSSQRSTTRVDSPRESAIQINSSRGPTIQIDSPGVPSIQLDSSRGPVIQVDPPQIPNISDENLPSLDATSRPNVHVFEVPGVSRPTFNDKHDNQRPTFSHPHQQSARPRTAGTRGGLICGGCDGPIIGRIVSAMGSRWHPQCFKCTVCSQLLEHVSSYEHDGKPYCHLDYHENFAPRCFSCKTAIIEERFISLDDPALGKRTYHEQHFFCAECGDPFLAPSMNNSSRSGELSVQGDGEFESDDVGFTVYKGHPYCEACHVRLRLPKCKRCKKSIRDHEQAVEALSGKWCWGCFVCASCEKPFENPSFFQRGDKPFCERCFDIMLRNEV